MRLAIAALCALSALVSAHEASSATVRRPAAAPPAVSIGAPNEGKLSGGAHLDAAPYLRVVPFYADSDVRWGLPALVGLVDRAARRVAHRFPDAVLSVGDLSRKGGGELDRHHSHESGRDADLGFYVRGANGKPWLADRFVAFRPDGVGTAVPAARFDDARNWALIDALLDDPVARVSHVFVATPLRARLLRYAEKMGVAAAVRDRAAEVMMQPRHSLAHDDHFHIRIACPRGQVGRCVERAAVPQRRAAPPVDRSRRRAGADHRPRAPLPRLPHVAAPEAESPAIAQASGEDVGEPATPQPLAE